MSSMRIKMKLLLASGAAGGIAISAIYCLLTEDARRKVLKAGRRTISSAKRALSSIDTKFIEGEQGDIKFHKRQIDKQWSELGY